MRPDELADGPALVGEVGREVAFESARPAFFRGGQLLAQPGERLVLALDRKRRLIAEDPAGDLGFALIERERLDQVLASRLDGRRVLVGQLPREQRVDARATFDQREQVRPFDRDVFLADRLTQVVVRDALGRADRRVEVVDRNRKPIEFVVPATVPSASSREGVLECVEVTVSFIPAVRWTATAAAIGSRFRAKRPADALGRSRRAPRVHRLTRTSPSTVTPANDSSMAITVEYPGRVRPVPGRPRRPPQRAPVSPHEPRCTVRRRSSPDTARGRGRRQALERFDATERLEDLVVGLRSSASRANSRTSSIRDRRGLG